jgi:hypothetical protein
MPGCPHNRQMKRNYLTLLFATAILPLSGCSGPAEPQTLEPVALAVPTGPESTGPRLSGGPDGSLVLSWMSPDEVDTSLHYSAFIDGQWTAARTVISEAAIFVNWADLPSVVPLGDNHLVAHWLGQSPADFYSYNVRISQSMNGGETWHAEISPHTDNTPTEHGFVSIFASDDQAGLVWLDGRKMINEVTDNPVESGMTLRAAFIDEESALSGEQLVDELICDCCQTDVAVAASGPLAVYRDRSVDEIRDISITRYVDGSWQPGQAVAEDNWEIAGCPVNGPSIDARDELVAVAWFTAVDSISKVQIATSVNSGRGFSDAVDIVSGDSLGRVGITFLNDESTAVSWLQRGKDGNATVMVRTVNSEAELGPARIISESASQFAVPQMAIVGDDLIFAWTEMHDDVEQVASAKLAIEALRD